MLKASGLPYVIENVEGAALVDPVVLCGSMFDLGATTKDGTRFHLERHRKFETNWPLRAPG
jgi:DNA (cytosine-5)-methyltransferase 1